MHDIAYKDRQRPHRMFAKMLSDSKQFLEAAKRAWEKAHRIANDWQSEEDNRPANVTVIDGTDSLRISRESALTVAMMNYTTSLELLLKAFVGVHMRFDDNSLSVMRDQIGHKSETVLDHIPPQWAKELRDLFQQTDAAQVQVVALWNSWNPPSGDWIGNTSRLDTNTLDEFLQLLSKEKLNVDRYSFELFADNDWRVKIAQYDKLESLHSGIESLLSEKAKETGCWRSTTEVTIGIAVDEEDGAVSKPMKVGFPTPQAAFELDKLSSRLFK